jgi:serine/threonine protein kinase
VHVVRLVDFLDAFSGGPGLVLELGEQSLHSWLRERGHRPSWSEVLEVGEALGLAIEFLHAESVVHGDIKPANLVRFARQWKLVDLAAAGPEGSTCEEVTSSYCPPETARLLLDGAPALRTTHADVWAFGKILYEMACGAPGALIDESSGGEGDATTLHALATMRDDIIREEQLRFPVLRLVLRDALRADAPRAAASALMQRGFWRGTPTASIELGSLALSPAASRPSSTSTDSLAGVWDQSPSHQRPGAERRRPVVRELMETEHAYCESLRVMSEQVAAWRSDEGVDLAEACAVFRELGDIQRLNRFFLRQLETRVRVEGERCLGEILQQFAETLMRNYARSYPAPPRPAPPRPDSWPRPPLRASLPEPRLRPLPSRARSGSPPPPSY